MLEQNEGGNVVASRIRTTMEVLTATGSTVNVARGDSEGGDVSAKKLPSSPGVADHEGAGNTR